MMGKDILSDNGRQDEAYGGGYGQAQSPSNGDIEPISHGITSPYNNYLSLNNTDGFHN